MAQGGGTDFLTGFLGAFTQAKNKKKENENIEQTRKLQTKLFEKQLEKMDLESGAQKQIGGMMEPYMPTGEESLGSAGGRELGKGMTLLDILADPRGQQLLMQSGMKPETIVGMQGKKGFDISQLPPGMVLGGVKITPDGEPMYDFEMPEIDKWVPSKTGLEMIGLDRQGREISRREAGPDERPKPSEEDKKKRELASALDVYEKAKQGLISGLEGTATAPVLGKLPAVTSSQQIAQGSVAAMAPVLKQLFRAAGEGVFTDRDQMLLLEMIPTRETNPKAREAMIQNIDAIVRAKLGQQGKAEKVIDFSELPD